MSRMSKIKGEFFSKKGIAFVIIVAFFLIFIVGYKPYGIYDAAVDPITGNVAILTTRPRLQVWVINNEGEIQYQKDLEEITDGSGLIGYDESGQLFFYAYRNNTAYCVWPVKNSATEKSDYSFAKEETFEEWKKHLTYKEIKIGNGSYRYQNGNYFSRRFGGKKATMIYVCNEGYDTTVWRES